MSARLIDLLLQRSRRERQLLAVLAVLLPLALALALLLPLQERRQQAEAARSDALALQAWVRARAAEKAALDAALPLPRDAAGAPAGLSGLEQGLNTAGLRSALSELGSEGGGAVTLRFDAVDFLRLAAWLSSVHPGWGYSIRSFRFEALEDAPGKAAARITLVPGGS
ncbi:type II secretion system protein M [Leisingera aquaemixtae]|uniref:type II secretion system protein GspM n=1 Tax=Leisingera aquaemixtae TaxID=1396826 RepID=UPI001C97B69C|nr:type II secretion system protein GspM [Leisingera aquaemixtae]MBY6069030.1 type II secretion system protein M [Leisingera aquaemixtae]